MAKNKTSETDKSVADFISKVGSEVQRDDSFRLIELMRDITGHDPKMWGPSIIGFGSYHYRYDSGHEGDAPLVGFSPRKAATSLYVFTGLEEHRHLLDDLGKFKTGKACIYVKKLSDIDEKKLTALMKKTIIFLKSKYKVA